jgi:hypothetical protein
MMARAPRPRGAMRGDPTTAGLAYAKGAGATTDATAGAARTGAVRTTAGAAAYVAMAGEAAYVAMAGAPR